MFDGVLEHAINGGKYGDDFASACFSLGNGIAYSKSGHEISSSRLLKNSAAFANVA